MAHSRFIKDAGLTARMTLVMFLLGALFVALIVGLMFAVEGPFVVLIGPAGIAMVFWQWWSSDKVAMKAMRAREVTPEEAPELHGMIDRLCAPADMPKPRVGIADMDLPNAFATGRSPDRSVVCVTTGILQLLDAEELEAVLAHELSHVAHRDVLVMTFASSAGILAGMLTRGAQFTGLSRGRGNNGGLPAVLIAVVVSLVVYAVSFLLLRLLSLPRAVRGPLGCLPHHEAAGPRVGPDEDLRGSGGHSAEGPARQQCGQLPVHRPGGRGHLDEDPDRNAPLARAAPRAARPHPGRAQPSDGLSP
ncbi:M48 family metalloprotease [Nocardioides sp. B-3]|uniref:M48 family metalloprotease n=1 Tax=Nocardioides sp. B-3 TaxID=2895565 RepID=UPI003FA52EC0